MATVSMHLSDLRRRYFYEGRDIGVLGRIRKWERYCGILSYAPSEIELAQAVLKETCPTTRILIYLTSKGHSFVEGPVPDESGESVEENLGSCYICTKCAVRRRWVGTWHVDGWHARDRPGAVVVPAFKSRRGRGKPIFNVDRISEVLHKWAERRVRSVR